MMMVMMMRMMIMVVMVVVAFKNHSGILMRKLASATFRGCQLTGA